MVGRRKPVSIVKEGRAKGVYPKSGCISHKSAFGEGQKIGGSDGEK